MIINFFLIVMGAENHGYFYFLELQIKFVTICALSLSRVNKQQDKKWGGPKNVNLILQVIRCVSNSNSSAEKIKQYQINMINDIFNLATNILRQLE